MLTGQYGGTAAGSAIPATAMQNVINAKESMTLLEQHLHELGKLNEVLSAAVQRTSGLADRLMGPEPQPPQGSNGAKPDVTAMFSRIEGAARLASTLAEVVHQQLNRLERL